MANYAFNYGFFFPTGEDGNDSLSSLDSRIEDALKLIQSKDDYIVFDDGVQCRTSEELKSAILSRIKSTINVSTNNQTEVIGGKYQTLLLAIVTVCTIILVMLRLIWGF